VTALQHLTRTLPIVFAAVGDPVGAGLVDTLARPGGNTTGFMVFEYGFSGKWLELLKQIAPQVTRAAGCMTWCPRRFALPCWSILPMSRSPRRRCAPRPACAG